MAEDSKQWRQFISRPTPGVRNYCWDSKLRWWWWTLDSYLLLTVFCQVTENCLHHLPWNCEHQSQHGCNCMASGCILSISLGQGLQGFWHNQDSYFLLKAIRIYKWPFFQMKAKWYISANTTKFNAKVNMQEVQFGCSLNFFWYSIQMSLSILQVPSNSFVFKSVTHSSPLLWWLEHKAK